MMVPCWIGDAIIGGLLGHGGYFTAAGFLAYMLVAVIIVALSFPGTMKEEPRVCLPGFGHLARLICSKSGIN